MAQFNCSKCDSQGLEWKEGIGKNTGKKWTAWYCPDCKLMHGMNGMPWGDKGSGGFSRPGASNSKPGPSHNPVQTVNSASNSLEKKVDLILDILRREFPNANDDVEVPF